MSNLSALNFTANALSGNAVITATGRRQSIQNFTKAMCQEQASSTGVQVTDARDNNQYYVRYINGNCWMVQNLRYVGDTGSSSGTMIMKSTTSNINANKTVTYTDLTNGNSYDVARLHVATSSQVPSGATYTATDMGVWYNYAAASAMTIAGESNSIDATYDICPKNWHMPTSANLNSMVSYSSAFSPITGGTYTYSSLQYSDFGYWWSATSYSSTSRYRVYWYNNELVVADWHRYDGYYVRCVRSN